MRTEMKTDLINLEKELLKFFQKYKSSGYLYEHKVLSAINGLTYTIHESLKEKK